MQSAIQNLTRICGYNQAARYFEETKKPRSVKWGEDERPLYNTRSHHYRLTKGDGYYDLVLYSTPMIRYYAPDENNHQRVLVRGHNSQTSNQFLWWHGFMRGKGFMCQDADGNERWGCMMLNIDTYKAPDYGIPSGWSADMMFLGDPTLTNLDLTRSKHIPGYKAATSDEDKWARKKVKTLCDHWIELLGYRLDEYLNSEIDTNKWQKQRAGESFTSALALLSYTETNAIKNAIDCAMSEDKTNMESEQFASAMTKLGHAVATHLQGVRRNQANQGWDYQTHKYIMSNIEPVTRADFRKSMESHLISLLNLRTGSARVDIGQFPESIPRRWWC